MPTRVDSVAEEQEMKSLFSQQNKQEASLPSVWYKIPHCVVSSELEPAFSLCLTRQANARKRIRCDSGQKKTWTSVIIIELLIIVPEKEEETK